jgi:hypothetical protein
MLCVCVYMHTRTRTRTLARTYARAHTRAHMYSTTPGCKSWYSCSRRRQTKCRCARGQNGSNVRYWPWVVVQHGPKWKSLRYSLCLCACVAALCCVLLLSLARTRSRKLAQSIQRAVCSVLCALYTCSCSRKLARALSLAFSLSLALALVSSLACSMALSLPPVCVRAHISLYICMRIALCMQHTQHNLLTQMHPLQPTLTARSLTSNLTKQT